MTASNKQLQKPKQLNFTELKHYESTCNELTDDRPQQVTNFVNHTQGSDSLTRLSHRLILADGADNDTFDDRLEAFRTEIDNN